ncbi:histone-lysine N-methyltransferase ASHH2-like [Camellia sinensis]|uniref:histone-lysine N-methyltransferase ASHH2-like n=1 Tax=Camellia sinensis TaxID=4442 RepID=UPI00103654C5|nr:histone-lysine N-methyltransferase ASHH2-like [Camellia sinensis]
MLTEILPILENACNFKEGSSSMDHNCAVEDLSVSQQTCEPFSVTDADPSKSLVAPDISGTEGLVGSFNSIGVVESSGQRDNEVKDNIKFDDSSELERPETICLSPPRSVHAHITKLNQKTLTKKALRKCGKTVIEKPLIDSVLFRVARKRRSYFCKPARSSVWGSLGHIRQLFEQNAAIDIIQNKQMKSRKARGVQGSRRRNKNQAGASSQRSKGKTCALSGPLRLKVKLGKEMGLICPTNMVSVIDNDLENYWGTSSIDVPNLTNGSENKSKGGDPEKVVMLSDASHVDVCLANKDLESTLISEKSATVTSDNHQRVPSQTQDEGLEVAVDNRYLDSGTSPDSEVINLIPEAQVNGKVQEDLHDVLMSSQVCVANEDVTSLNMPPKNKKGKKKYELPCADNFIVEDRLPSPEIINKASVLEKQGQGEKMGDGFYSSEASISTTTANMSGNTSSSEGFPRELLPLSRVADIGVSCEALKVESGTEEDPCFRHGAGLESPESHVSDKLLPCAKTKGRKHVKSSKSRGASKSGSEVSDSSRSGIGNASRQKGNPLKSVNRRKLKDKSACDQVVCRVENHPETGDHSSDDPGKSKTGNANTTRDVFSLDMVPRVVGEQYLPPRNAWVRCDDCFKWRRIPATLADSIEETNCKWTCKDNMDKGFSGCSIPQEKSNAEINAELEISDASCEEDACDARLNSKILEAKHSTVQQPSSWVLIKSNLFLHRSRKTQTIDEIMVCHCKRPPDGRVGCGDKCLNRMLNIECVKRTCPCGELCSNQQFQKRKYAKLQCYRCGKKGYGLQSLEDISEGQFLIEYVGEVLDMLAYQTRQREYASKGHKHFYFMTLNGSEVIDACAKGNLGRFINHSCDPNCRTEKWMVNGEVCIGLFALRDIKKGEEVTFDYNYVRVFGAAAKKCVCGSSQCRGYIGGDRLNTEVIVQGDSDDEYPEPVMVYEDGKIDNDFKNLISATSSFDGTEMQIADRMLSNKDKMDKSATAVGPLESTTELQTTKILGEDEDETDKSATAVQHLEIPTRKSLNKSASGECLQISLAMDNSVEKLPPSVQQVVTSSQLDDMMGKTISNAKQEFVQRLETSALIVISNKSLSNTIDAKKKCNSDIIEDRCASKSYPLMKTSRLSSSVKKGKLNSNSVNVHKPDMMVNKSPVLPYKPKRIMEGSLNGRLEYVEETLNGLLDADGGISKRKDASKGYLMLLLQTATSGDSGNGEAIQSNRDLSMILDGLLKTKSRMVLVDIINTNGLQMLHNIMKQYRRDFNKIPILRKLLKVLEYLAVREILTLEHITGGPRYPGVESFRESILILTEHDDKQVHQIARNFRDRWIPRSARHISCLDRSNGKVEFHWGSNCNRHSASQRDQGVKTIEAINCINQSIVATNSVDAGTVEGGSSSCASGCPTNGTKTRKRKSRWDQPAVEKEPKVQPSLLQISHSGLQPEIGQVVDHKNGIHREDKPCSGYVHDISQQMEANRADDGGQNLEDDDVPPGFAPPRNGPSVPSNASSMVTDIHRENRIPAKCPREVGHPQARFLNRLPVSHGIPSSVVHQFGTPQGETLESWVIAPGVPFRPFPPLPLHSRDKRASPGFAGNPNQPAEKGEQGSHHRAICHSDQNPPSTSGATPADVEIQGGYNQHTFQRGVGGSYSLGRRYFRQQKWNSSIQGPTWMCKRNNWGFMGNKNSRNGMCSIGVATVANEVKGPNSSQNVSTGVGSAYNTFHQYPHQQNYH